MAKNNMKTLIFKKHTNHSIHGNKLEYIGEGAIQDLYAKHNDNDFYPSEDGKSARDANGNEIWEEGDKTIDSHDNWFYYSTEESKLTEEEVELINQ